MTTQDRQDGKLLALVESCYPALRHPWLREIAAKAPSPTAADEHTKGLGLPNTIARAVRDATRIHAQYPMSWKELCDTGERPAAVCRFGETHPLGVEFLTELHFGDHSVDVSNRPLLMRDFRVPERDWNSFDGTGHATPSRLDYRDGMWATFPFKPRLRPTCFVYAERQWQLCFEGQSIWPYDIRVAAWNATSTSGSGIPLFWKVIEVQKPLTNGQRGHERLRAIIRTDVMKPDHDMGRLEYAQVVPYDSPTDGGQKVAIAVARFYLVLANLREVGAWEAKFITNSSPQTTGTPSIYLDVENTNAGHYAPFQVTMTRLIAVLARLKHCRAQVDLDTLIGGQFFKAPPDHLIDLVA